MRTTYQKTSMRFGFFRACAFRAKNPECYGGFWQCKRYKTTPGFLDFGFCQCKWALYIFFFFGGGGLEADRKRNKERQRHHENENEVGNGHG